MVDEIYQLLEGINEGALRSEQIVKELRSFSGPGLSISYGILKQHGGQIDVNSAPGNGAEFVITLPLKQSV